MPANLNIVILCVGASNLLQRLGTLGVRGCERHYEARSRKTGTIDPINVFSVLVRQVRIMPFDKRRAHMREVCTAFNIAVSVANRSSQQTARTVRAVNTVVLWMINDPPEFKLVSIYRQLQGPLDRLTSTISNPTHKVLIKRYAFLMVPSRETFSSSTITFSVCLGYLGL